MTTTPDDVMRDPENHMPTYQTHSVAGRPRRDPAATAMNLGRLTALNRRNGNHDTAGLIAGQTFPELLSRHPGAMTASLVRDFLDEYDRTRAEKETPKP